MDTKDIAYYFRELARTNDNTAMDCNNVSNAQYFAGKADAYKMAAAYIEMIGAK